MAASSSFQPGPAPVAGIPPFAGLCTFEEASRSAVSVEQCVDWLKRFHYGFVRLHEILTSRITSEPQYELKTAFSHHAYLCAEHAATIRTRVGEMREPPLGLEVVPHPGLELLFDELRAAPTARELCCGLYGQVVPWMIDSIDDYLGRTNHLADAPSVRILRFAQLELGTLRQFGKHAIAALEAGRPPCGELECWTDALSEAYDAADGFSGLASPGEISAETSPKLPARKYSATPYQYDNVPRRDARFQDSYNAGVNPEAFLYDTRFSPRDKTLMMFYKRIREIDVPEMMASILADRHGKPWGFVRDMSRQLWDESRHAMMGEVGFRVLGIDWSAIPINFTWSLNLNTQLTPKERHAVLFFIEQGLMPKTGKRYEWEVGKASGVPLSGLFQDFDWADEVLHAQIGRQWYVTDFPSLADALAYGDQCWSRVMSHWHEYRDQGLTEHRNWWPEVYRSACETWGISPDPEAMAFSETYATVRADLKTISASG